MGTNLKLPFVHKQAPDNPKTVLPEETFISTSVVSKEARMVWYLYSVWTWKSPNLVTCRQGTTAIQTLFGE